ncbi:hypothetical protein PAJ34TS1_41640 [Paenibacillus azoreducens]|uniref:Uncharacterized protein n=1 Tax=Paenibacillus azoreducens TaxID=116718 RepID=A0A919YHI9_9BACL|nr:hypothetical protein J34TS1_56190 [Paenibacillus azoreducens]
MPLAETNDENNSDGFQELEFDDQKRPSDNGTNRIAIWRASGNAGDFEEITAGKPSGMPDGFFFIYSHD